MLKRTAAAARPIRPATGRTMRNALLAFVVVVAAGCAATPPAPPQPVRYRCDDGRQFAVTYQPGGRFAHIEIARMRFELEAEPADELGERYGCGVLTLWREARGARVEMQGEAMYSNCRPQDSGPEHENSFTVMEL